MAYESIKITRREFITRGAGAVAGAALLGGVANSAFSDIKPERKPNLVFVFADQCRAAALGCMGDPNVKTPNLDRLASQGLLFTNAISNFPICAPYRAMLLTGRYGTSTGVIANGAELPDTETTFAQVLKKQGYKTGYIGKWHLEKHHDAFVPKERRFGFDYWASRNVGGENFNNFYCTDTPKEIPLPGYEADAQTDLAIDFIKKNAKDPFCLVVSWRPPHPPMGAPKKFEDLYTPSRLKLRPNVTGRDVRQNLVRYYGMISDIDDNMGRIMKTLEESGIADDTIVCFSSDHGDMFGSQGRNGKDVPFEESINVPFILRYPKAVKAGAKTDVLFSAVDVMPTLLSLCGAPIPKSVQGKDQSGVVLGRGGEGPDAVLLQRIFGYSALPKTDIIEWRGVRTRRYTYARSRSAGWLLYDNEKDPYQMNNLLDKPEHKALRDEMDAKLQKLMKDVGDDFATSDEWRKRIGSHAGNRIRNSGGSPRRSRKKHTGDEGE